MSGKIIKGRAIRTLLHKMAIELSNAGINAEFVISQRNVPYISIQIGTNKYSIAFFGKSQKFRVFRDYYKLEDFESREAVIEFMHTLKETK